MAWPFSRLRTYVNGAPPTIDGDDLNAMQDAIAALYGTPYLFGTGVDGTHSLDGVVAAPSWASKSGATYTLNRDVSAQDLTLTSTARINTNGYRLLVRGTLTVGASAIVHCNGADAAATVQGAAGNVGTLGTGSAGGVGGVYPTNPNPGGSVGSAGLGAAGGAGGTGNGGGAQDVGEAGGTVTNPTAGMGAYYNVHTLTLGHVLGIVGGASTWTYLRGGAGGGGGGGAVNTGGTFIDNGGGGGGGGGVLLVAARHIVNEGIIQARGGNGGDYSTQTGTPDGDAGGGGGGGGGGGLVLMIYATLEGAGDVNADGGAGGLGRPGSGAVDGTDGVDGRVITMEAMAA